MRTVSTVCRWLAAALLVIATAFQLLALIGGVLPNTTFRENNPWLVTMWVAALALLPAAAIPLKWLRYKKSWPLLPLIMAAVGTLLTLLVALALRDAFPAQLASNGGTQGLTAWRLIYRHFSSVAAGALLVVAALLDLIENRNDRIRRENEEYRSVYDLSGDALFKDDSTIGLERFADQEELPPKKRKRSVRHAAKKAAEKARQAAD